MSSAAADLDALSPAEIAALDARKRWLDLANDPKRKGKQIPPRPATIGRDYDIALWLAGRGFGKTLTVAQAGWWEAWRVPKIIVHAVAPDKGDLRTVLMEGPAGLLSCIPNECLKGGSRDAGGYVKGPQPKITLANGSIILGFGASDGGEELRGPQSHCSIGDEIASWDKPAGKLKEAFSNMALGTRLPYPDGTPSRIYLAGTPKGIPFIRELLARPDVHVVRGTTYENIVNLSRNFTNTILAMEGTALGRQEIMGELVDLDDIGIFRRSWFQLWPHDMRLPEFSFLIISLDTAFEEENYDPKRQEVDYTACTIWGVFNLAEAFPAEMKRRAKIENVPRYGVLLCDAWQDRIEFPELLEKAKKTARIRWGSPGRKADLTLIENQGAGRSLRQVMGRLGVPVMAFNPGKMSKTQRAHAASPIVKQKMVFLPESKMPERAGKPRDWVEPFLDQVCSFAGKGSVEHDDYLDTFSQVLLYLHDRDMLVPLPPKEDPDVLLEREARRAQSELNREKGSINPYAQ